jgi:cold shock CspA family protein
VNRRTGRVTGFDGHVGLGTVADESGQWPFHCTQIADGTRTVAVGAPVDFELRPAHAGRIEAYDLRTW